MDILRSTVLQGQIVLPRLISDRSERTVILPATAAGDLLKLAHSGSGFVCSNAAGA